jgi:hypothetical protein
LFPIVCFGTFHLDGAVLEHFFKRFHKKLWRNIFIGFPGRVLESTLLPSQVDLFFQRKDFAGQSMGGHADSCQTLLL